MHEQLDFFEEEPGIILAYDADDPPPKVGYSELHYYLFNHFAEECARFARLFGLI